jgi:hypothetical protein
MLSLYFFATVRFYSTPSLRKTNRKIPFPLQPSSFPFPPSQIRELFGTQLFGTQAGPVRGVGLNFGLNGKFGGTATISFSRKTAVLAAYKKFHNVTLGGELH